MAVRNECEDQKIEEDREQREGPMGLAKRASRMRVPFGLARRKL